MKFLKKILKQIVVGNRKYARVLRHDGKLYMLDRSEDKLVVWSVKFKDYPKHAVMSFLREPRLMVLNALLTPSIALIFFIIGLPLSSAIIFTALSFALMNVALIKMISVSDDIVVPLLARYGSSNWVFEYSALRKETLWRSVKQLPDSKIIEVVDNLTELENLEKIIDTTELFLNRNRQEKSVFNGEVAQKLNMLKLKKKELIDLQSIPRVDSSCDSEALSILQLAEDYLTASDSKMTVEQDMKIALESLEENSSEVVFSDRKSETVKSYR